MATYGWGKNRPVAEELFAEGHRFSFYQAVRLLERLFPGRVPVGEDVDPDQEVVHFSSEVRQSFPGGDVAEVRRGAAPAGPAWMSVHVMGVAGLTGPLPSSFSDLVVDRLREGDATMRDFLDVFNHRLVSIFYRGRKKHCPPLDHDGPHGGRTARCLYALLGLGMPPLRDRMRAPDRSLLPFVGLFLGQRSMVGLEVFLTDYFGFPVQVEPFRGAWHHLEEHQLTRIGRSGQNRVLGESAVLAGRFWDQQSAFELRLGPLDFQQMLQVLPVARGFEKLCDVVRFYVGEELDFHVRYILKRDEIPALQIGPAGDARLGWSSRLPGRRRRALPPLRQRRAHPPSDAATPRPAGSARPELRLGGSGDARLGWTTWLPGRAPDDDGVVVVRGIVRQVGEAVEP